MLKGSQQQGVALNNRGVTCILSSTSSVHLQAHLDPAKGHPHLCACICMTCKLSSGWRSWAGRQCQVAGKVGLDALCEDRGGASVVKTKGHHNVKEVVLVIVAQNSLRVSKYLCGCGEHVLVLPSKNSVHLGLLLCLLGCFFLWVLQSCCENSTAPLRGDVYWYYDPFM